MAMSDERAATLHSPSVGTLAGDAGGVGLSMMGPEAAVHTSTPGEAPVCAAGVTQ